MPPSEDEAVPASPSVVSAAPGDAPATPTPSSRAVALPPAAAPALAADEVVTYAPELPIDLLRRVFAPLAGDAETLSAAACVCVAWRAAALEPALWSRACLSFTPKAARRLTDVALAALVQRTGNALERVNVTACTRLTARGVADALRGRKLTTLAMRGVKSSRRDAKVVPLLRALVRRPTGLDLRAHTVCGGRLLSNGGRCGRLCVPADALCTACDLTRCVHCTARHKSVRKPPCAHACDACFRASGPLTDCGACGRVPNGFCEGCTRSCDDCDAAFCAGCSFAGGALLKCDGPGCTAVFCEPCGLDEESLLSCEGCSKRYCESCALDGEQMTFCEACDEVPFCTRCAFNYTNEVGGLICPNCKADESDSDYDDSGDELHGLDIHVVVG
jgi:hypothetical protein